MGLLGYALLVLSRRVGRYARAQHLLCGSGAIARHAIPGGPLCAVSRFRSPHGVSIALDAKFVIRGDRSIGAVSMRRIIIARAPNITDESLKG